MNMEGEAASLRIWTALQEEGCSILPITLKSVLSATGNGEAAANPKKWLEAQSLMLRLEQVAQGWEKDLPIHLQGAAPEGLYKTTPTSPSSKSAEDATIKSCTGVRDLGFLFDAALPSQQFDVLRHGVFLNRESRLLLVAISGESDVAQPGETAGANFAEQWEESRQVRTATSAATAIVTVDHEFAVLQITDDAEMPNGVEVHAPLRLVFRNEAANYAKMTDSIANQSAHFPVFQLRSVFASHTRFYPSLNDQAAQEKDMAILQQNQGGHAVVPLLLEQQRGELVRKTRLQGGHDAICEIWVDVLEALAFASLAGRSSGASLVTQPPTAEAVLAAIKRGPQRALQQLNEAGLAFPYRTSGRRLTSRFEVRERSSELVRSWRMGTLAEEAGNATCYRVLFRDSRTGHNFVEVDEVVAFIPTDEECIPPETNVTEAPEPRELAKERIRLWVLKALLTAEVHRCHQLLLEIDYAMIIGQCIGLLEVPPGEVLAGADVSVEEEIILKRKNAMFHITRIFIETIEDFVQHSGNIWRVVLMVTEPSYLELAQSLLRAVRMAKRDMEQQLFFAYEDETNEKQRITTGAIAIRDGSVGITNEQLTTMANGISTLTPRIHTSAVDTAPVPLSANITNQASSLRLKITDDQLYPLFKYCDVNGDGAVSVAEMVKVFLCKENKIQHFHEKAVGMPYRRLMTLEEEAKKQPANLVHNPLSALDGCGLPFEEGSMTQFVASFCRGGRRPRRAGTSGTSAALLEDGELKMNYSEFAMMMLALARR